MKVIVLFAFLVFVNSAVAGSYTVTTSAIQDEVLIDLAARPGGKTAAENVQILFNAAIENYVSAYRGQLRDSARTDLMTMDQTAIVSAIDAAPLCASTVPSRSPAGCLIQNEKDRLKANFGKVTK